MDPLCARTIAYSNHGDQRDRSGALLVAHLERVAASVPVDARVVAFLHDLLEHTDASILELEAQGVSPTELAAIRLLTRAPGESFEAHTLRIAHARGPAGRLARVVKLADIEDHVAAEPPAAPLPGRPYRWASSQVAACQKRLDNAPRLHPVG
jgi:hypothetical protein